jgi:hypothetical protein
MRIAAYIPLHYGLEYLKESIQAIEPFVEVIYIIYTKIPSFGFSTTMKCPETEKELKKLALNTSNKVQWIEGEYGQENAHRARIFSLIGDEKYDLVLTVDADEIWNQESLKQCIQEAFSSKARYIGINGFLNFWKSFNHVCLDHFAPIRFINLHNSNTEQQFINGVVYHFSCAQKLKLIKYKLDIHGHKDEIRPGWLKNIYLKWTPENNLQNLHLVAEGLWNAVPFDKQLLPQSLHEHVNFNKDVIL